MHSSLPLPCCPCLHRCTAAAAAAAAAVSRFYLQPAEIYVDDEAKLTLHGLVQHYVMLHEEEKNRKLTDLLDALDFNQVRAPGWLHPVLSCRSRLSYWRMLGLCDVLLVGRGAVGELCCVAVILGNTNISRWVDGGAAAVQSVLLCTLCMMCCIGVRMQCLCAVD
jgi:hypothetical protein